MLSLSKHEFAPRLVLRQAQDEATNLFHHVFVVTRRIVGAQARQTGRQILVVDIVGRTRRRTFGRTLNRTLGLRRGGCRRAAARRQLRRPG